jgi:hypothetical protein
VGKYLREKYLRGKYLREDKISARRNILCGSICSCRQLSAQILVVTRMWWQRCEGGLFILCFVHNLCVFSVAMSMSINTFILLVKTTTRQEEHETEQTPCPARKMRHSRFTFSRLFHSTLMPTTRWTRRSCPAAAECMCTTQSASRSRQCYRIRVDCGCFFKTIRMFC